jgi:hypothetical protein
MQLRIEMFQIYDTNPEISKGERLLFMGSAAPELLEFPLVCRFDDECMQVPCKELHLESIPFSHLVF